MLSKPQVLSSTKSGTLYVVEHEHGLSPAVFSFRNEGKLPSVTSFSFSHTHGSHLAGNSLFSAVLSCGFIEADISSLVFTKVKSYTLDSTFEAHSLGRLFFRRWYSVVEVWE